MQKSKNVQTDLKSSRLKSSKNVSTRGKKAKSKNNKKAIPVVPLRRSARKAKCLVLQKKKQRGRKKGKPVKSKKGTKEKPRKVPSCKRKRTEVSCSYWLNGLQFSRKPNDERVLLFRSKSFQSASEEPSITRNQPKCQLCDEAGHNSTLNYIACEICKGIVFFFLHTYIHTYVLTYVCISVYIYWFSSIPLLLMFTFFLYRTEWLHADAIGVHSDNIENITGFRCHNCCERDPPVCPHSMIVKFKSDVSQLVEIQNDAAAECTEEVSNAVPPLSEVCFNCFDISSS